MTHKVDTGIQAKPTDLSLQGWSELSLARDNPMQLRMPLLQLLGSADQRCMILMGDERRHIRGHTRVRGKPEQGADAQAAGVAASLQ
jgi:hypothetical protein